MDKLEGSAIISIEEYDTLRKFKKEIIEGKKCVIRNGIFGSVVAEYYTDNEIVKEFENKLEEVKNSVENHYQKFKDLQLENLKLKEKLRNYENSWNNWFKRIFKIK